MSDPLLDVLTRWRDLSPFANHLVLSEILDALFKHAAGLEARVGLHKMQTPPVHVAFVDPAAFAAARAALASAPGNARIIVGPPALFTVTAGTVDADAPIITVGNQIAGYPLADDCHTWVLGIGSEYEVSHLKAVVTAAEARTPRQAATRIAGMPGAIAIDRGLTR